LTVDPKRYPIALRFFPTIGWRTHIITGGTGKYKASHGKARNGSQ
jgi:hypothetical protein